MLRRRRPPRRRTRLLLRSRPCLPLARLHARYHGGQLHVAETRGTGSYRGPGVHAAFTLDLRSRRAEPEEVALPVGPE